MFGCSQFVGNNKIPRNWFGHRKRIGSSRTRKLGEKIFKKTKETWKFFFREQYQNFFFENNRTNINSRRPLDNFSTVFRNSDNKFTVIHTCHVRSQDNIIVVHRETSYLAKSILVVRFAQWLGETEKLIDGYFCSTLVSGRLEDHFPPQIWCTPTTSPSILCATSSVYRSSLTLPLTSWI